MKKFLSLSAGMVLLLAFGIAYADDAKQWNEDTMIKDQDLQNYDQDLNKGTVNQMPAPELKGSGAGGSGDSTVKDDSPVKPGPVEDMGPDPYDNSGRGKDDTYKGMEKYDHDTYRY